MMMFRKLWLRVLLLALFLGLAVSVRGYAITDWDRMNSYAGTLYTLELFKGTGVDAEGNPVFSLDKPATRLHAAVMLVRLLGAEEEALKMNYAFPFQDVPAWGAPYVGYVYEKKLSFGISGEKFGSGDPITPTQYLTFIMRALGYSTNGADPDFAWNEAAGFADSIGLTHGEYSGGSGAFLREDIVDISFSGLTQEMKGTGVELVESLTSSEAVSKDLAASVGLVDSENDVIRDGNSVTFTIRRDQYGNAYTTKKAILSAYPDAHRVLMVRGIKPFLYLTVSAPVPRSAPRPGDPYKLAFQYAYFEATFGVKYASPWPKQLVAEIATMDEFLYLDNEAYFIVNEAGDVLAVAERDLYMFMNSVPMDRDRNELVFSSAVSFDGRSAADEVNREVSDGMSVYNPGNISVTGFLNDYVNEYGGVVDRFLVAGANGVDLSKVYFRGYASTAPLDMNQIMYAMYSAAFEIRLDVNLHYVEDTDGSIVLENFAYRIYEQLPSVKADGETVYYFNLIPVRDALPYGIEIIYDSNGFILGYADYSGY